MSLQGWQETLVSLQVDGPALNTSTTATSLLGTATGVSSASKFTIPANYWAIGRVMQASARGRISNIVTSPGTLTLDIRFGSTVVWNGGAFSLNATAKTNVSWALDVMLTCRAVGASTSANLIGIGTFTSESVVGAAAGTAVTVSLPASAPAVGTGFDSTVSQVVDLFGTFSVSNASNSIQVHQFLLESLN